MGRWLLGALGAAAAAVVALLLWELGDSPLAPRPRPEPPAPERAPAVDLPEVPDLPVAGPAPARRLRHVPTVAEVGEHRMELLLAGDVPQRVLRAAAGCYGGESGRSERMTVNYTLRFDDGRASLEDVELVESEIGAPQLEQCVVDTMRELTWTDRRAPNLLRKMAAEISVLDLKARQPRDPRADHTPDENQLDE